MARNNHRTSGRTNKVANVHEQRKTSNKELEKLLLSAGRVATRIRRRADTAHLLVELTLIEEMDREPARRPGGVQHAVCSWEVKLLARSTRPFSGSTEELA